MHTVDGCQDAPLADLLEVLDQHTGVVCTGATRASTLDELGFDSLARIEVVAMFDDAGFELPEDLVAELRTIGDLHDLWNGRRAAPAAPPARERNRVPLVGPTVRLEPLAAGDLSWAYDVHTHPSTLARYRARATTPSPEAFHHLIWQGVVAQFVVVAHGSTRVGLVSLFDADWRNRHAHLAVVADPAWSGSGLVLEGLGLLIDWTFDQYDLRKLYFEALAGNLDRYRTGVGRRFLIEGVLTEHEFVDGRWEDLVVGAVRRDTWGHPAAGRNSR